MPPRHRATTPPRHHADTGGQSMRSFFFASLLVASYGSYSGESANAAGAMQPSPGYPAAAGFNEAGSDPRAIAIAHDVMHALGGYQSWNRTRFVTWNFFGRRTHVWDKHTGRLRFESEDTLVLMNLQSKEGRVWKDGVEMTDPGTRDEEVDRAHGAWINDSYWVFMPYKLKDSGVTLKFLGEGTTEAGAAADVIELTFDNVGRTPENKYHVYVDKESRLVTQWDYYPNASDPEPRFRIPWLNWQRHGDILLSADRGERKHEALAVLHDVPDSVFQGVEPVNVLKYAR
jgi:hypothetical protein